MSRQELSALLGKQRDAEVAAIVEQLNHCHAIINIGGNVCVMNEERDPLTGHDDITLSSPDGLRLKYAAHQPVVTESGKPLCLADAWMMSPQRREYAGLTFLPGGAHTIGGYYNMWRGWPIKPDAGQDCSEFLELMRDVLCGHNGELYEYLLDWLADMIQNPADKPGVAMVLRGEQGTGKTFIVETIGRLFGQYYLKISQGRHITGNFNFHLKSLQLIFAEEAFFAGDRHAANILKDMVTSDTLLVEPKGKPVVRVPNYLRIIMASNEDFVAPAGPGERRYFVLDANASRQLDWAFFEALKAKLDNGTLAGLMHFLLTREITCNLRNVPKTKALLEQKLHHLDPFDRWWLCVLERGEFSVPRPGGDPAYSREVIPWSEYVALHDLHDDFLTFCKEHAINGYRNDRVVFGKLLRKRTTSKADKIKESRRTGVRRFRMPDLATCRQLFDAHLGQNHTWPYEEPS